MRRKILAIGLAALISVGTNVATGTSPTAKRSVKARFINACIFKDKRHRVPELDLQWFIYLTAERFKKELNTEFRIAGQGEYNGDFAGSSSDVDANLPECGQCDYRFIISNFAPKFFQIKKLLPNAQIEDWQYVGGASSRFWKFEIVFDVSSALKDKDAGGNNLAVTIAMHEFGHLRGLEHNPNRGSIMYKQLNDTRGYWFPAELKKVLADN